MSEWENGQILDPQEPESESEIAKAEIIEIAGEPKYYTTGQVAKILGENESTIRFWCDEFDQFLKILRSGRKPPIYFIGYQKARIHKVPAA